ncbi:hypothetical protein [Anaerocolumna xylanovorans]|uniref:Fibronectin type-III domain-containing protein n=1 Tax=Anaerocolumna xylanovorans DSM 12503 TaxID=1121345 RepID=A0A1M7Y3Q8_9FIRM|nr:hypothetical protein [Anaerocolumna xylanovorans]SHO46859.1 hypothetical protein SAMN02745217_01314 [Anaerocolumna xylanovorans DSM 12503]
MKLSKKLCIFTILFLLSVLFIAPVRADAATVGQPLTSPEEGWQRFDSEDPKLHYEGAWFRETKGTAVNAWNHAENYSWGGDNSTIRFKFYGTKIRIISSTFSNKRTDNIIIIDGEYKTFSEYGSSSAWQSLVYEKSSLKPGIHTVIIKSSPDMTSSQNICLDAIDIDSDGYLIDYYQSPKLTATPGDSKVILNWDAVDGATSYTIKRSATAGAPYEIIGTSTTNSYVNAELTNGTTYYYVIVPVVSGNEKTPSNEASATPTAITNPDYIGNYATLVITMTNGGTKEYTLPVIDVDKFITWYDQKSDGTGKSYYTFTKASNISPYLRIREYISFDKISSFELKEFNQ